MAAGETRSKAPGNPGGDIRQYEKKLKEARSKAARSLVCLNARAARNTVGVENTISNTKTRTNISHEVAPPPATRMSAEHMPIAAVKTTSETLKQRATKISERLGKRSRTALCERLVIVSSLEGFYRSARVSPTPSPP